ncbi:hypothetical protein D3C77_526140 [compost metagenome]
MIAVSWKPAASSAPRIAWTWPSIAADGAMKSAPAAAAITACLPRLTRVASLSTPWSCTTPQWPWLVYSQKQVSDITTISGTVSLQIRAMRATRPFSFQVSLPTSSRWCETPKVITDLMPARA